MDQKHEVIIVGAGVSGLAAAHFLAGAGIFALLLEADQRPGGAIRSFHEEGYRAEWGPHGFLDNNPDSRQLLAETGLDQEALKAPLGSNVRFVCHHGRLVALPQGPRALLTTPLLSLAGKLRLAAEPFKQPLADGASIGQWAEHRFGREVLPLVDAAVTGTFAGDYQRLSIDAVMPGARRLEKAHGSLLWGLWREKRQKRKQSSADGSDSRQAKAAGGSRLPAMTSFPQGMEHLATRLSEGKDIRYQCGIEKIRPLAEGGWEVSGRDGVFQARHLVLALPVNRALELLSDFGPPVTTIPEARIVTVALGFNQQHASIPPGFGYLAPERENRFTLGALFSSHMFPQRAPDNHVLLEALVGGRRHPERLELDDETMIASIYEDLRQLLPLNAPPDFARVLRGAGGIPQLEQDHPRLLAWREELAQKHPDLLLSGFGWDGIGINDMIKAARKTADLIAQGRKDKEQDKVRPIYF